MSIVALQETERPARISVGRIVPLSLRLLFGSLGSGWAAWVLCAIIFTGTDLVDLIYRSGDLHAPLSLASLAVRVVGALVVPVVIWRIMLPRDGRRVWAADGRFWRYAAAFVAINLVTVPLLFVAKIVLRPIMHALPLDPALHRYAVYVEVFILALIILFVTLKLTLWTVALAIGDRDVGFVVSWRRTYGCLFAFFGALLAVILPFETAHFGLTALAQRGGFGATQTFWIVIADGLVTVPVVMGMAAVAAAVYRLAAERAEAR